MTVVRSGHTNATRTYATALPDSVHISISRSFWRFSRGNGFDRACLSVDPMRSDPLVHHGRRGFGWLAVADVSGDVRFANESFI